MTKFNVWTISVLAGCAAAVLVGCKSDPKSELDYDAYARSRDYAMGKGSVDDLKKLVDLKNMNQLTPRQSADLSRLAINVPMDKILADAELKTKILPDPGRATNILYGRVVYEAGYGEPAPMANTTALKIGFGKDRMPRLPGKDVKTNDLGFYSIAFDSDPAGYRCDAISILADPPKAPGQKSEPMRWSAKSDNWDVQKVSGQPGVFYMSDILLYRLPQVLGGNGGSPSGATAK